MWNGMSEFKYKLYVDCNLYSMKLYGWIGMWNCETDLGNG